MELLNPPRSPVPLRLCRDPELTSRVRLPVFFNRIAAVLLSKAVMMIVRVRQQLVASASRGYLVKGMRSASSNSADKANSVFDNVLVERKERVGIIQLNRPKVTACSFQ